LIGWIRLTQIHTLHKTIQTIGGLITVDRSSPSFPQHRIHGVITVSPFLNPLHVAELNFLPLSDAVADKFDSQANIRGQHKL
jgi:hypothetical protein